jgi:PRELI-like family
LQTKDTNLDCEGEDIQTNNATWFVDKKATQLLGGSEDAYVREVSFVDPKNCTTSVHSVNLSLSQYVTCLERIHYTPHPTLPEKTIFSQTAEIQTRVRYWRSMSDKLETWMTERFGQNAALGRLGFEFVLERLWKDDRKVIDL